MRPSEEIALEVDDCDLTQGKVKVSKARVMRHDKDRTKTGEDRTVELCPRATEARRQAPPRERLLPGGPQSSIPWRRQNLPVVWHWNRLKDG